MTERQPPKYRAFISYNHRDSVICAKLHRRLDGYRPPPELVGAETDLGRVPDRLHPVFRDREELATSADLPSTIKDALEQSGHLVVICSPNAAASKWVDAEIAYFVEMGRANRIHPVIVEGEPPDCFPPSLREALADLEERGLITTRPGGGTFVADILGSAFSPPLIELFATHDTALFDYLAFRRDLEGLAAERAALNATDTDLAVIDAVFPRMEAASVKRKPDEEAAIDAEFHMSIVEAAHNVVMLHMMRSLYDLLVRGVWYNRNAVYAARASRAALLDQHRAIRDAVCARDPAGARKAIEAHMDFVADALREFDRVRTREQVAELRRRHEERRAGKTSGRARRANG